MELDPGFHKAEFRARERSYVHIAGMNVHGCSMFGITDLDMGNVLLTFIIEHGNDEAKEDRYNRHVMLRRVEHHCVFNQVKRDAGLFFRIWYDGSKHVVGIDVKTARPHDSAQRRSQG